MRNFWIAALAALTLAGCTTQRVTTSDGWPMPPQPRKAPQPPSSLKADRMAFMVGSKADDTNNNGYADSIRVSVSLFSSRHPTAIQQDGAFVFSMYAQGQVGAPDSKPIGEWRIEGERRQNALSRALAGPCYLLQLSVLDFGSDRLGVDRADIICRFEPADGSPPFNCDGVRSIQIGRPASLSAMNVAAP